MRNKNGKRAREEPQARMAESVVRNRRFEGRTPTKDTSSSQNSCLSTTEEVKEEVASSWVDEVELPDPEMVVVGCRRCLMYAMVLQERQRCPKCKRTDVIVFN
ncbi:hypothetical protein CARUB_v10018867mg [Capsella rubella]|uniref:GIR1-like zinc ribbon domain-containing protein n=1 Tax=Capsella rubella TaxID=81985 RepID=R0HNP4_9BRAS|nr:uncharacterized protein LOC17885847 [Capsella rubella]EOA25523.1 hypothetical protein CARUB_v10018867mg [Capsella rubella]